jgi:hypothetical protein
MREENKADNKPINFSISLYFPPEILANEGKLNANVHKTWFRTFKIQEVQKIQNTENTEKE